jgi:hypothetical protein
LTIQMPPPDVQGENPHVTFRAITFDRSTTRPAANKVTPPPLAGPLFSVITFSINSAAESPPM